MRNYTFHTPEHSYTFEPDPLDQDIITVSSEYRDSVEDLLKTIELSGRANDADFQELSIEVDGHEDGPIYSVDVTRDDLAVFFEFEVRYFMGVPVQ